MSDAALAPITAALDRFFDDGSNDALELACRLAAEGAFDIAALLAWLDAAPAEDESKDRATRRIRAAIGLPPMPGAACRPVTFGANGRIVKR